MGQGQKPQCFPVDIFEQSRTPLYYYDLDLLHKTLDEINRLTDNDQILVHYAVKANGNRRILEEISNKGLGADLVSGGEIQAALEAGFSPSKITDTREEHFIKACTGIVLIFLVSLTSFKDSQ